MYRLFMTVEEAEELAVFIALKCTEHIDGCEPPISLLSWKVGQRDGVYRILLLSKQSLTVLRIIACAKIWWIIGKSKLRT